ncbi:DUF3817 domain-containing protein [Roseomonas hellenica]|uniref:DUF3817 domain-containing protein n=1 Tax=Plastoroseomonas hellenica TaxID=2687306 RepID=A0ABS5EUP3_9PROT|nr:DUF3817 domain-containing protein [Plastoroseomonas hellenica]MBR0664021.1 DUF3817 domain-containing protein [Plastoroseomonas hellenica]
MQREKIAGRGAATAVADQAAERAQLRRLEIASVIEAATLLLLIGLAVPLKHLAGWEPGVKAMGPIHGLAFVAFAWTAMQTVAGGGWSRAEVARLFALAFLPFGGFLNLGLLSRKAAALQPGNVGP